MGKKIKRFISLGYQPLANNLKKKKSDFSNLYPLEVNFCEECYNCQLSVAIDSENCLRIIYIHRPHPKYSEIIF